MNKRIFIILLCITLVAFLLRFYKLYQIPPGINRDEGSIAYTAYSLLQTGRDEYGRWFPISFQSFGDWKLPLYMYIVMAPTALFGMSEFTVRCPSALFGTFTVFATYFLVKELFWFQTKDKKIPQSLEILAVLSAVLLAISPWHLHLSRVESEVNTGVFLTILAVTFLLKSFREKPWLIFLSFVLFALTYFTYAGNVVFTTVLLLGMGILFRKELKKNKYTVPGFILFLLLSSFIFYHTLFGANTTKLSGINIFGDPSVVHAKIELPRNEHESASLFARAVHNKVIFGTERFIQNYLNSFSPQFLFIKGGENRAHNIAGFGNMYIIESIFLFFGLVYLLKSNQTQGIKLILLWFFIAPLAASITKDAPHSNRMFSIMPMLPLITAIGITETVQWSKNLLPKLNLAKFAIVFIFIAYLINMGIYFDRYFVHFPKNEGEHWGVGYKRLYEVLDKDEYKGKEIIMSHPEYSHYIYLLFYQQYNPADYQATARRYHTIEDGFVHVKKYDHFEFRDIKWEEDTKISNRVLIAFPDEVPTEIKSRHYKTQDIVLDDGEPMFTLIETQ